MYTYIHIKIYRDNDVVDDSGGYRVIIVFIVWILAISVMFLRDALP